MPSSASFSARTTVGDRQQYEIQKLNDATSDSQRGGVGARRLSSVTGWAARNLAVIRGYP
jgi:hypothetical protein